MKNKKMIMTALIMIFLIPLFLISGEEKKYFKDFTLQTTDDTEISLYEKYKDQNKLIILDMFAFWCGPCKMEIPGFIELQKKYPDDLIMIGVSYDRTSLKEILKSKKKFNINYDLLKGDDKLVAYINLRGIPRTFILSPSFEVLEDFTGYHSVADFEQVIKEFIAERDMEKD